MHTNIHSHRSPRIMENPAALEQHDYQANVDTSRPFRSVKEAIAIFGERLLLREKYSPYSSSSPKPYTKQEYASSWKHETSTTEDIISAHDIDDDDEEEEEEMSDAVVVVDTLKRLEAELEETKVELKLLKERESETEVALASLNAELHKNMSKMAQAEAAAAAKASLHVATRSTPTTFNSTTTEKDQERTKREWMIRMENSTTLAQILSIGTDQKQGYGYGGGKRERKMTKKKPIVPLVQDLFSRKKGSSTFQNSLYSSPLYY